jgi:hypothetical protein
VRGGQLSIGSWSSELSVLHQLQVCQVFVFLALSCFLFNNEFLVCSPGRYQTGTGMQSANSCLSCIAGTYQSGYGMVASSSCTACEIGQYQSAEASTMCIRCASGKLTAALAASHAFLCILKSFPLAQDALQISMIFSLTEAAFIELQNSYVETAARALQLDETLFQILTVQVETVTRRTLESPAIRAVMGVNISKSNCTAILILTGRDLLGMIRAAGLPRPSQISSNADCAVSTLSNASFAPEQTLSEELRGHAVAINNVVVTVLAASVVSNVALQIVSGISLTSTASSTGASIYHLIGAVQFLNIFGKMFAKREPAYFQHKVFHSSTQRRDMSAIGSLRNLSAELNTTLSAASEFRSFDCGLLTQRALFVFVLVPRLDVHVRCPLHSFVSSCADFRHRSS